ncbi:GNAT family N-acetyltransferase [Herbiconiux sp. P15]|uniref:GNAT family N-acetyltransferase n=1 Tax=Herbiconiux liukaitaii TaxID=3342799 RepID=UPI0035BA5EA4
MRRAATAALPGEGVVRYEVKHVWLTLEARGHGWARELMLEFERRAREFGATELVLDTHHTLEGAARLYDRLGYESVPPYNDNPNATRWYRKALSA